MHNMNPEWLIQMLQGQRQMFIQNVFDRNKWVGSAGKWLPQATANAAPATQNNYALTAANTVKEGGFSGADAERYKKPKTDFLDKLGGAENMFNAASSGMNMASAAIDPIDHRTAANDVLDIGASVAGMIPGPGGAVAKGILTGVNLLDQAVGKNAITQATAGETATGYGLQFNTNASTKYGGLFGNKKRKQTNTLTNRYDISNIKKLGVSNKNDKNMLASSNSMQDVAKKNYNRLRGGYNTNILAAKKGTKLKLTRLVKEVTERGVKNVIPSGALHARKNHLPEEIAKQVTSKGIPVISKGEKGDIIQHAEIEHSEIIFTKEVTDKLEDLLKKGDDKAAIAAGKILAFEILENTEDNTNLIEITE